MAKTGSGSKPKRDKDFLRKPKYEGGSKAFKAFIAEHLRYPSEALEKRIQGDVHVKYDVDEEGNVIDAKVMRAIGGGCDEEALRVVRLLKYIPARNRGTHITTHHDVVLHFRLPLEHVAPTQHSISPGIPQNAPVATPQVLPLSLGNGFSMNYVFVPAAPQEPAEEEKAEQKSDVVFRWTLES